MVISTTHAVLCEAKLMGCEQGLFKLIQTTMLIPSSPKNLLQNVISSS
jgi:hypothetical protein